MLFLRLEQQEEIGIGALGDISFDEGVYIYTGSARNSLESRIERHYGDPETLHWHIDYLSSESEVFDHFILPEASVFECRMAKKLSGFCEEIRDFGSSDCDCSSHLFRLPPDFSL